MSPDPVLRRNAVHTIKFLSADAVQKANSGHPGMPMGAADFAFVLWSDFLRYDPDSPHWADRDRFVLSAGHGSMLLYSLLHLAGYELSMDELESFRQWGSKTPGHPEFGHTVGVEATTGPLGQGIGNAVGMALAGKMLADRFNGVSDDFDPVSHRIFCLVSDGDLMEGISGEAGSLAGHLRLGNLIALYDDNHITIEGATSLAFSEDVGKRFEGYGWHVERVDGHDARAVTAALTKAVERDDRPSLIACKTKIAHGAPTKEGTADSHGAPLGEEELAAAKKAADWPQEPFHVPQDVREYFEARAEEGRALRTAWEQRFEAWREAHSEKAVEWDAIHERTVPGDIVERLLAEAPTDAGATRAHGGAVLQVAAREVPALVGGSADLAPSTKTIIKGSPSVAPGEYGGRNFHFGIREHAMGAMLNGFLYHGAFRPYGATFLVFSDYMRPSIRLAALTGLPAIYVFTHDSIFVGEDGPTHQPIEHAAALRVIPNCHVYRPADGVETALAWGQALERTDGPSCLLLTRQKVPPLEREATGELAEMRRGGYLVAGDERPDAVIPATGSEVHLALEARRELAEDGKKLNVVSIPCLERYLEQDGSYRRRLFPAGVPVATVEAGTTDGWRWLAGIDGVTLGIDRFGASAPGATVAEKLGLSAAGVTASLRKWLGGN